MRAKFHVESLTTHSGGAVTAILMPVRRGANDSSENTQFWEATPIGKLEMTITNTNAQSFLKPGKSYYLDFSEADSSI